MEITLSLDQKTLIVIAVIVGIILYLLIGSIVSVVFMFFATECSHDEKDGIFYMIIWPGIALLGIAYGTLILVTRPYVWLQYKLIKLLKTFKK